MIKVGAAPATKANLPSLGAHTRGETPPSERRHLGYQSHEPGPRPASTGRMGRGAGDRLLVPFQGDWILMDEMAAPFTRAVTAPFTRAATRAANTNGVWSRAIPPGVGPSRPIRIVFADGQPLILDGLQHVLSREPDLSVVARCRDGVEALEAVQQHDPDILILDVWMRGKDGFVLLRELREQKRRTRVVLLTAGLKDEEMVEALRLGVRGVVLKEMPSRVLVQCLRKVHAGGQWVETRLLARAMDAMLQQEAVERELSRELTPRELEVVRKAVLGLSNRSIAEQLHVSEGTVKIHLHKIYEKLNVNGRFLLMAWAREHGLT
jgi:two-component system, NarL family, nitrate/nitrite response regulator NarL